MTNPRETIVAVLDKENAKHCMDFLTKFFNDATVEDLKKKDQEVFEAYESFKFFLTMAVNADLDEVPILEHHAPFYHALHKEFMNQETQKFMDSLPKGVTVIQMSGSQDVEALIQLLMGDDSNEN